MKPLSEYPRPQLRRDSYLCLNGKWDYKITKSDAIPDFFEGKILVPYSPECELSGVNHILEPDEYLYYKLDFKLDYEFLDDKVLLHFLAVDQICDVYLNGKHLGHHEGGYLPFHFEVKKYLKERNTLILRVRDLTDKSYYSRGKQKLKHGGIWYTPQSGIWLPVFLEAVPDQFVEDIKLTPDIDNQTLSVKVISTGKEAVINIEDKDITIPTNKDVVIKINNMHLWSPEDPYLYPLTIKVGRDKVSSYFAMRKFSIIKDDNDKPRLALNNKPIFMKGVLDQGYYKKGLLTPPSYQDYINDIELAKDLGFNTIRKHIKIEVPLWYYECDKRGMIVWQDFVNGGRKYKKPITLWPIFGRYNIKDYHHHLLGRQDKIGREMAIEEFKQTINYLYNVPSIGLWTIFNEGWGQFDAKKVLDIVKEIDNTRLYDHASGWHDQHIGDIRSLHVYFQKVRLIKRKRCVILSEFGGLVLPIEGHVMEGDSVYTKFNSKEEFLAMYKKMIDRDIISNIPKGLSASIYTQLSDVEEETNGFITYDREVVKIDKKDIKDINDKIHL